MKKICAFAASFFLVGGIAAYAAEPVTLIVPQTNEPKTLSPNIAYDSGGFHSTSNIYSHLVIMDWGITKGVAAYGDLAESWTISDDGKVFTFTLHDGAMWHDGMPVTSADVKFTFDTIIEKKYPFFSYLRDVKEITTPDEKTVVIELNEPNVAFVSMQAQAANWHGKIYPKHIWEGEDGFDAGPHVNDPVGSGPFMLDSWERGSHVTLRSNPDYFRGKSKVDTLIFKVVPDANVARAEFDANAFPYLPYDYAPSLAEVPALEQDPSVQVVFTPSHYGRDIQLNTGKPPLDDLAVRQAVARAIDREAMNKLGFSGYWKPAYNAIVDSQDKWLNADARFPDFDAEAAEAMLDEAGHPRGDDGWRFQLSVTNPTFADCRVMMEILVQQLREVGIDARWDQYDYSTWYSKMQGGDYNISCYFTRYGPDPDAYAEHFGTGGARNFMGYSNPELDRLAAEARATPDEAVRRAKYQEIQAHLVRDLPYINLMNEFKPSLIRDGWSGFNVQESGYGKSYTWFGYYGVQPPE